MLLLLKLKGEAPGFPEFGEAGLDVDGGADVEDGAGAAGIPVGEGGLQIGVDGLAALGAVEVVVDEEEGGGVGAVDGVACGPFVAFDPLGAGGGEDFLQGREKDEVVLVGREVAADVVADGGVDAGEVVGAAGGVCGGHVFGEALEEPRRGAPEEIVHAEVGEFVHEEILVGFGEEAGGLGGGWIEEDVGADEDALATAIVVARRTVRTARAVVVEGVAVEDDAGFLTLGRGPEGEGEGLEEEGDGFDDGGELGEAGGVDGLVGMEAEVGGFVGEGDVIGGLGGDDLGGRGLEFLGPGIGVLGEGGEGEEGREEEMGGGGHWGRWGTSRRDAAGTACGGTPKPRLG